MNGLAAEINEIVRQLTARDGATWSPAWRLKLGVFLGSTGQAVSAVYRVLANNDPSQPIEYVIERGGNRPGGDLDTVLRTATQFGYDVWAPIGIAARLNPLYQPTGPIRMQLALPSAAATQRYTQAGWRILYPRRA